MAYRPQVLKRLAGKPPIALMLMALLIAIPISYVLLKIAGHSKKTTSESIPVSKLVKAPPAIIYEELNGKHTDILQKLPTNPSTEKATIKEPPKESAMAKKVVSTAIVHKATNEKSTIALVIPKPKPELKLKDNQWQTVTPRSGDSMAIIFHRLGLSAKNLHEVLKKNPYSKILTSIKPSQEFQFLINKKRLEKLVIPIDYVQTLTVYREGSIYKTQVSSKKTTKHERYITATVRGSLYTTAQRNNIPSKLIRQMTEVLGKQIDFVHSVRSGDRFSIAYEAEYIGDKIVGIGDIVAVNYNNGGKTAQAMRHVNARGERNYYTPLGGSFKKAFSRYPLKFSHISSTFTTSRYHPILHYKRAHKGIDLAAPIGTPIQATGDGTIATIGRHNGYGNMIKITHDKTYSTVYGHMLKFQKGLYKGSHVKRGQVIGYVGQTGLATGPHCHFELHVKNQPKNPTTTYLPTAASVPARELARFKTKARATFARLKLMETTPVMVAQLNMKKSKTS